MRFAITFVCQAGELEAKAVLLAASLRRFLAGSADLVACVPESGPLAAATRRILQALDVRSVAIRNPLDPTYPIGNKVACMAAATADRVLFLDSDIICLAPLDLGRHFTADFTVKPADHATFSGRAEDWSRLYRHFGLADPVRRVRATVSGDAMWPYFNAGVIGVRGDVGFAETWARCCREIDADEAVPQRRPHLDQIGLPLAAALCGLDFVELPERLNFPAHARRLDREHPVLCHYHWPTILAREPALAALVAALVRDHPAIGEVLAGTEGWRDLVAPSPAPAHDIDHSTLEWALERSPGPATLRELVALGRERFGWFSRQVSRAFEYPWVANALIETSGLPVLDIGTGVSPLPLLLAARGVPVVTVDHSTVIRRPGAGETDWNGWGFLDYGALHPAIRSLNVDAADADIPAGSLAAAYSVSVLEHVPARTRRRLWPRIAEWLAPGGRLLLTFDLLPGTDALWNRERGRVVESAAAHGTVDAIVAELAELGFTPVSRETLRDLPGMKADCALLDFRGPGMAAGCRPWRLPWGRRLKSPAFLVGCMRSGTTLLADLLGKSPGVVHCPFELKHVWSAAGGVPMASPRTRDATCPELDAGAVRPGQAARLADAFLEELQRQGGRHGDVFLTKNPHLVNKLPFVHALFPDARFIFIRRRMPAVVASLVALFDNVLAKRRTWHVWPETTKPQATRCWEAFHHVPPPPTIDRQRCFPGGDIRYLAEYWLDGNLAIARFMAGLHPGAAISVTTEDLLAAPEHEVARCLEHLGVAPLDPAVIRAAVDPGRGAMRRDRISRASLVDLLNFVEERRGDFDTVAPGMADVTAAALDEALGSAV